MAVAQLRKEALAILAAASEEQQFFAAELKLKSARLLMEAQHAKAEAEDPKPAEGKKEAELPKPAEPKASVSEVSLR